VSWRQVDPDELQALIDKAARIGKTITDRLAEINKRVGDMHPGWAGEAAAAHKVARAVWIKAALDMRDALGTTHAESGNARRGYTGVVDHLKGMWPQT